MAKTSIESMKTSEMSKMNFDEILAAGKVSESDTPALREIPVEQIRTNAANFYTVDDVKELADSIAVHGLLDPVVVTPDGDGFLLISVHRRFKAWGQLREQDPDRYAKIPAIVRTFPSPQMAELALIMANSTSRQLHWSEISKQAERIERLLYELKEQGYAFPGRMREQVAKACQVSSTKLARLKVIRDDLAPEWGGRRETGKLPEETAYQLARLSPEIQRRFFFCEPDVFAEAVAKVGKMIAEEGLTYDGTQLKRGCDRCNHGDAFLRHDLNDPWNACKGETCCLYCDRANREWSPCTRMCSAAKKARKVQADTEKAKKKAEEEKKLSRIQTALRERAIRLVKAADAAGVPDDTKLRTRYTWTTVDIVRKIASGEKTGEYGMDILAPEELDVNAVARALQCSADYVCGLSDELHPAAAKPEAAAPELQPIPTWYFGEPTVPGRYLCLVDMNAGGYAEVHEQQCDWDSTLVKGWSAYGRPIGDMFEVVAWYALPPKWSTPALRPEEKEEDEDV